MQPGIFTQRSRRQSQARYVDGDNVRWYQGLPQKIGGFTEEFLVDTNGNPLWYYGHVRGTKQWDSLDQQNWIALGTEYKLYVINNAQLYDITPLRATTTIFNGFSTVIGTRLITVVDPSHGANTGDFVTYAGATAFANVTLNSEFQVVNVIDLDTYQIAVEVPISATVTNGGGTVLASYDWPSGLTDAGSLLGYGVGGYGLGPYGTPRSFSTLIGEARIWSLDNWGEDLLASPNGEALFWWQRSSGPNSRAIIRPNAPPNIERMLVGPDDRHVIALGTNLLSADLTTVQGQQDRMFMRWCVGDNFDDWVETASNDAGSERLDIGSRLITACKTRTSFLIFSDENLYNASLVGGTDVYQVLPLDAAGVSIISPNACVDVLGKAYWMGQNGFFNYDGTLTIMQCDVLDYVFGSKGYAATGIGYPGMNRSMQDKVTCRIRENFTEVLWSFPSLNSDENDSTVIYNWAMQCWYISSIPREHGLDTNTYFGVPIGFNDTGVYLEETGVDVSDEEALFNFLATWEGEITSTGRNDPAGNQTMWVTTAGSSVMSLLKLIPDFKQLTGSVTFQAQGRESSGSPLVYGQRLVCLPTTAFLEPEFRQRRISIYMESDTMGDFWQMDTLDGESIPYGRR